MDCVVGNVSRKKKSRIKEILLATPFTVSHLAEPNFRGSRSLREKRETYAPRKFGAIR